MSLRVDPVTKKMLWQYILNYTLLLLYLVSYIKHIVGNLQSTGLGNLYDHRN